ncbi:hypothetical protein [Pedobacter sp. B4-66]|uniref:hypothetical protein n=1 Tax=Pedobacter sp. B4-66 TaxID=2817280 RepID=UPI001BD95B16|nr:hypothetical protein [Pedobacter sp. B4-66]
MKNSQRIILGGVSYGKTVFLRLYKDIIDSMAKNEFERNRPLTQAEMIYYCTGTPIDQIEYLFKTFEVQGLLLETDIMQLASMGIPIFKAFADHFGCEMSQVRPMSRDHVIRYPDFVTVIDKLTSPGGLFYLDKKPSFA